MGWISTAVIAASLTLFVGVESKHVGCYYGVWAYTRPGLGEFWPEDIDVSLCDIIYYGFGNVLNGTYEVCSWDPWFDMAMSDEADKTIKNCVQERDGIEWPPGCYTDSGLEYCHYDGMRRTIALKEKNPDLKVLFSVGGWTAGGWIFSQMASTAENRHKFIVSLIHFMKYFGFDGLDLDWEFPGYDMLPEEPTNPDDKIHFTALMRELRQAFDVDGYLLTFAGSPDPYKAGNAYELDKIVDYIDWINVMSYDYSGAWDNFTGIDAPLYGRWGEGFVGHPKYQFNMHETFQHYLKYIPANKLAMGIHTESKGWVLATPNNASQAGIYCPAYEGSPNMTYSRQVGWLNYYEILQFWHNETIEDPRWDDLKPGKESWTIYDKEAGNWDGCYLSPYMHQGRYWISYDDEHSSDVKVRYANHYNLLGAFVWEVDTDNFRGLYGKKPYNILSAINDAHVGGKGLEADEIHGYANDNQGCMPQAPFCELPLPDPQCEVDNDCNEDNDIVCDQEYSNCYYCDHGQCNPGCSDNQNCWEGTTCNGNHFCEAVVLNAITTITARTSSCSECSSGMAEEGLQVHLICKYGPECTTGQLDNSDLHDYGSMNVAMFNSTILGGTDDHGLGGCNNFDLNVGVTGGTASWTGPGTWHPTPQQSICVDFYGNNKPTCCCTLPQQSLSNADGEVNLTCDCFMP